MNPYFNNWLIKNKGISFEELDKKSQEEKMTMWKEYCQYKDDKRKEYNMLRRQN